MGYLVSNLIGQLVSHIVGTLAGHLTINLVSHFTLPKHVSNMSLTYLRPVPNISMISTLLAPQSVSLHVSILFLTYAFQSLTCAKRVPNMCVRCVKCVLKMSLKCHKYVPNKWLKCS